MRLMNENIMRVTVRSSTLKPNFKSKMLKPKSASIGFVTGCIALFLVDSVLLRFLLPLGDEPDYYIRLSTMMDSYLQPVYSPYVLLSDLTHSIINFPVPICVMQSDSLSLWATIDGYSCTEPWLRIVYRVTLMVIILLPLFCSAFQKINKS